MRSASDVPEVFAQPTARTFRLEALVKFVHDGRVRVPHFQRSFRWDVRDVVKLFDSILRGYPVGSVLLWQRPAPAARVEIGSITIHAPSASDALWVVDGQQRITSLVNAVSAEAYDRDDKFRLDYDLTSGTIVRHAEADKALSVPLPILFDLRRLLKWIQDHPELFDRISLLNEIAVRLRDFELPASVVAQADHTVLQEIFDRMNNSGKRLRRAEVFSAIFAAAEEEVDDALTIQRVAEQVEEQSGFGRIDDDTVLRVILARRGPDVTRDLHREFEADRKASAVEFPSEDRDGAFENGKEALLRAISFARNEAGVPHFSFLPYRFLLIVLARYFAHFPEPSPRNVELLTRWFWRAALAGPAVFKGSATGAARAFARLVQPGQPDQSIQRLLDSVNDDRLYFLPDLGRFRTNEAASRIVLCALWSHGPERVSDGEKLTIDDVASALQSSATALDLVGEIFPRGTLAEHVRFSAGNRFILIANDSEEVAHQILFEDFMDPEPEVTSRIRASHFINDHILDLFRAGDAESVIASRQKLMEVWVRQFVDANTGRGLDSTPPLSSLILDDETREADE